MEEHYKAETFTPTDRTFQDVLSAGSAELDQSAFEIAAHDAQSKAVRVDGNSYEKQQLFDKQLLANCEMLQRGDSDVIHRRVTMVVSLSAPPPFQCFFGPVGARLTYAGKGDDKHWSEAAVFP